MKFNKIFSALFSGAMLLGTVACTDEVEFTPADPVAGEGVYFPEDVTSAEILQGSSSVTLDLLRTNDNGPLTVNLESSVTDKDGNPLANDFTIPTHAQFVAGSLMAPIDITYDWTKVEAEVDFYVHIKVPAELSTPYGLSEQTFVLKYSPWSEFKRYGGTEMGTGTLSGFDMSDIEVPVYESESLVGAGKQYRFGGYLVDEAYPEAQGYPGSYVNGYNFIVRVSPTSLGGKYSHLYPATLEPVATGDDQSFGEMIMITDVYTFRTRVGGNIYPGNTDEELQRVSVYNSQTGLFSIHCVYYTGTTAQLTADEYMQLPGFKDYSLSFSYKGNMVAPDGSESVIIEAYRSDDVASYSYAIKAGELTNDEIAQTVTEIQNDSEAELIYDALTNLEFTPDEPGVYTIVGVGYDAAGAKVCQQAFTFEFESVQKESDWEEAGTVLYTDGILYGLFNNIGGETYQVKLEKHKTTPNYYRLVNPYAPYASAGIVSSGKHYINFYKGSTSNYVALDWSETGLRVNGDNWSVASMVYPLLDQYDVDVIARSQYSYVLGTMEDGVIEFPAGLINRYIYPEGTENDGYISNYSDALIDAFNNLPDENDPGFDAALNALFSGMQIHAYGMGKFAIDMMDIAAAPARSNFGGVKAGVNAEFNSAARMVKAPAVVTSLPGNMPKLARKPVEAKKVDGKLFRKGYTFKINDKF